MVGEFENMETSMARKMMMALVALAAIGLVQPTVALARGGGHGAQPFALGARRLSPDVR